VEEMRAEKTEKFAELKDKKGKPEYKEGYDTVLVSDLYNKMMDDMKIIILLIL
jgi:hypothetical protein